MSVGVHLATVHGHVAILLFHEPPVLLLRGEERPGRHRAVRESRSAGRREAIDVRPRSPSHGSGGAPPTAQIKTAGVGSPGSRHIPTEPRTGANRYLVTAFSKTPTGRCTKSTRCRTRPLKGRPCGHVDEPRRPEAERGEPSTKGQAPCDSTYTDTRHHGQRERKERWRPGAGELAFSRNRVLVWENEIPETHGGDGRVAT